MAMKLYASAAVPTLEAAARVSGLSPAALYQHRFYHRALHLESEQTMNAAITERAIDASAIIRKLTGTALSTIGLLMEQSESERIRLDAAKDVLDRNPETSKTQKIQLDNMSLGAKDAKALADALVESARARQLHELPAGDSIRLPKALPSLSKDSSND